MPLKYRPTGFMSSLALLGGLIGSSASSVEAQIHPDIWLRLSRPRPPAIRPVPRPAPSGLLGRAREIPDPSRVARLTVVGASPVDAAVAATGTDDEVARGALYAWTLGDALVGAVVVVAERALGPFEPETEYHRFAPDLRARLRRADFDREPLRLSARADLDWVEGGEAPESVALSTPRTFALAGKATRLSNEPANERYLFHLESGRKHVGARVDHYLLVRFTGADPCPELTWYVDAGTFTRKRGPDLRADDVAWEVRPVDDGILTPVESAVGYEMVPREAKPAADLGAALRGPAFRLPFPEPAQRFPMRW